MGLEKPLYHNDDYEGYLYKLKQKPKAQALEEVMEKLALLSYFVGKEPRIFMALGNPIFQALYSGYFSDIKADAALSLYEEKVKPYSDTVKAMLAEGVRLARRLKGRGRERLMPFRQAAEKIAEKEVKGYALDAVRSKMKMDAIFQTLTQQVFKNVERREKEGIPQTTTKMYLEEYLKGRYTRQNMEVVEKLIAEANTQLGLLKLPSRFDKYKNTMVETVKQTAKLITGDSTSQALLKLAIAKENLKENTLPASPIAQHTYQVQAVLERDKDVGIEGFGSELTPEKVKAMGLQQASDVNLTIDKGGKLVYRADDSAAVQRKKKELEEEQRRAREVLKTSKEFQESVGRATEQGGRDFERAKRMHEALELGQSMDDDLVYRRLLRKSRRYQKIREEATGKPLDPILLKRVKAVSSDRPILANDIGRSKSLRRRTN